MTTPTRPTSVPEDMPRAAPVGAAPAFEDEDRLMVAELVEPVDSENAESVADIFAVEDEPGEH